MAEINKKQSPFEKELQEAQKIVLGYKLGCEANVVSMLYKNPEFLLDSNLSLDDFNHNQWKVFFEIINKLVTTEKKIKIDEITIGLYLEKHEKLKKKYELYGGYKTILRSGEYVKIENFNGYLADLRKWKAVLQLCKDGFPVLNKLSNFSDMTAEEIYNEYSLMLNSTFSNIDSDIKSYDLTDNIHELINKLDEGVAIGLPYYDMPMLTEETGGQYLGSITLLGGMSNSGKSTIARSTTIPSIIKLNEKVVVMVNEDSLAKWQREMLVWVCNNIFKFDIQKHTVRDGKYTDEVKQKLHEAADWLIEKTENHTITVIPFQHYNTSKAIKEIRKYAALGVKYFILDTFKMDAGKVSEYSWLSLQQNMVAIKDVVKAEALNLHILITFQLEKGSSVMRYYTQNNIGVSKNIVDVASTCIMVRDLLEDEYTDGKKAIKVYRLEGKNKRTKVSVKLESDKKYQVFFIVKNQEGQSNSRQLVIEHDKSRNIIKELGICNILPDW